MHYLAVLLTVHNRKEKTLECLRLLFAQQQLNDIQFDVFLTDDGCTDGTPEAVLQLYPSVHIVQGDGNLFWNRGMHKAWEAASTTKDYDFYLWLNDDTFLFNDALSCVLKLSESVLNLSIIVGPTCSKITGSLTYSGEVINTEEKIVPNGMLQECDIINGNFVLIPAFVFNELGNLDFQFRHAIGDFDYGLRARKRNIKCYIATKYIGTCEENELLPKWCLTTIPLIKRIQFLYSPLGYAEPISFFKFDIRHFGLKLAIRHFLSIHYRVLFPGLYNKFWRK